MSPAPLLLRRRTVIARPTLALGSALYTRMAESTGSVYNVSTIAQLQTQYAAVPNGSIINITASIDGAGSTVYLTRAATAAAPITITSSPGVLLTNFYQILPRGPFLRLRGLNIGYAQRDNIKLDSTAHDIELDGCVIHHAGKGVQSAGYTQGINIQPSPYNIQIWNSIIYSNGRENNGIHDHGMYWAYSRVGGGNVLANCVMYDNNTFNIQLYPDCAGLIMTCCTVDGGEVHTIPSESRGGIIITGNDYVATHDNKLVGVISTNAPNFAGFGGSWVGSGNTVEDGVSYGNSDGAYEASAITYTNILTGNPNYSNRGAKNFRPLVGSSAIGAIQPSRYPYVPPRDILGNLRITADAGAYAYGY